MFTLGALAAAVAVAVIVHFANNRERPEGRPINETDIQLAALHSRQDLRLIAYFLMLIVVLLGVIADRLG